MLRLEWGKCTENVWCSFKRLRLDDDLNSWYGVYIIWTQYSGYRTIEYVGEGIIGHRIHAHRNDDRFKMVSDEALVSWARVSDVLTGLPIESYLIETLKPRINEKGSRYYPIEVNLPWDL